MASSRWKRFAFFDRQTLTIPSDVTEDLIPSTSTSLLAVVNDNQQEPQLPVVRNNEIDTKDSDYTSDTTGTNDVARSIRSLTIAGEESLRNGAVSLVVTTAALPFLSRPVMPLDQSQQLSQIKSETQSSSTTENDNNNSSALEAMWSSLTACSSSPFDPNVIEKSMVSATIELPSQSQQSLAQTSTSASKSSQSQQELKVNKGNNPDSSGALDGLVLSFLSSKHTHLVHCFDITARCSAQSSGTSRRAVATTNEISMQTVVDGANDSTNDRNDRTIAPALEELDGWRGYFSPIPPQLVQQIDRQHHLTSGTRNSSQAGSDDIDISLRILGIAACRYPDGHRPLHIASISDKHLTVWEDPHLHLVCRKPFTNNPTSIPTDAVVYTTNSTRPMPSQQQSSLRLSMDGDYRVVDIVPGMVAVGTSTGIVIVYVYAYQSTGTRRTLRPYLRIPSPPGVSAIEVVSVKLSLGPRKAFAFVSYTRNASSVSGNASLNNNSNNQSSAGICCYEIPTYNIQSSNMISAPSARHDLDGRYVSSSALIDSFFTHSLNTEEQSSYEEKLRLAVARPDGIYSYSHSERIGVAPIDGSKQAICLIPPPVAVEKSRDVALSSNLGEGCGYVLVASTDSKSGRDAVDVYDIYNNLVAFHLLLSPGHRALRASGITTIASGSYEGTNATNRRGQSSAVVLTSGGSLVTLIEKKTEEKISVLIQKNLYSAAIAVAYSDPSYDSSDVTSLYQAYAEYLYAKGDFSGAMEQYMYTIGSIETSHVIFRYLDAPKIPFLVKYLEKLKSLSLATAVHNDLLRTCYLKLNDTQAAEGINVSSLSHQAVQRSKSPPNTSTTIMANLTTNPKEALIAVCSLEAPQAAEVIAAHGASLARAHPRETAGIVISLCLGTYSPSALAEVALGTNPAVLYKMLQYQNNTTADHLKHCEPYAVQAFLPKTFVEHPKMLRLVLAHCNRNKVPLTPSLRRTLLELTLAEWNQAKRTGDAEALKLRRKEAIAALTDSHCRDIGDYDALVIVQLASFEEGELLLYERLQMTPMLLARYAADGSEKSRRRMLAMCQTDPEILADVLRHFVSIASDKLNREHANSSETFETDELEEIMDEIQECLALAKRQGVLPPVRIARILAGEHSGQFRCERTSQRDQQHRKTVPLSVALDYIGTILDESRTEIIRLTADVEEYNQLCNVMEHEIDSLFRISGVLPPSTDHPQSAKSLSDNRLNIDDLYAKIRNEEPEQFADRIITSDAKEAFWREIHQSEDPFETVSRFFAKGVIS